MDTEKLVWNVICLLYLLAAFLLAVTICLAALML